MKTVLHLFFMLLTTLLLFACSTPAMFDSKAVDLTITAQQASESKTIQGISVLWGGMIIASTNLQDTTQLEILAYPLASNQRPDTEQAPIGRFIAIYQGYLEKSDYAQGRLITMKGELQGKRSGRIGESEYIYPVLNTTQQHLWKKISPRDPPRFHFGLGLML
ncbi:Slp family lipoprotein [Psychromonas antarctica]|uniref:Slp family lipoprotein n=1 Tax=Psychromonas antarctica TaxID=67573 RepID=UPI001EE870E3|nr:Slp family lipoprotein [Psychromonas antarctica]MCG6201291.1 Slp family lipoprotein [Psychromonas antarctica]